MLTGASSLVRRSIRPKLSRECRSDARRRSTLPSLQPHGPFHRSWAIRWIHIGLGYRDKGYRTHYGRTCQGHRQRQVRPTPVPGTVEPSPIIRTFPVGLETPNTSSQPRRTGTASYGTCSLASGSRLFGSIPRCWEHHSTREIGGENGEHFHKEVSLT